MTGLLSRLPFMPKPGPAIPLVRMEGAIGMGGRFAKGLSLETVARPLDKAFAMKAPAVAIAVNSPGGRPVQARLIHDRIRALAEEKKRPVFVFCEDAAASGGYMIALAGDEIFADVGSIMGSIGVVSASFGAQDAIARLGVERRVYTAGRNKARLDPFRPETDDDIAFVRRIQDAIHADFIDLVKTRRGAKLDVSGDLYQGDVWLGREALALGLIDGIGHAREILKEKFGPDARLKPIAPVKPSLAQRLLGGAVDDAMAAVEARGLWARVGL